MAPLATKSKTFSVMVGILVLAILAVPPVRAETPEDVVLGIYGPLPLKEREEPVLQTARESEALFVRRGHRLRSLELEALVERVGRPLAPEPTDPYIEYRFFVFDDPLPNAFALPDGQIYINSGMLALLYTEAQLAALLAHEIAHTAGHHGILDFRKTRKKLIGATLLPMGGYFFVRSIYGYNRQLEAEADQRAFDSLLEHGYDVRGLSELFEILGRDIEGDRPETPTKWSTHPEMEARAEQTRMRILALSPEVDLAVFKTGEDGFRALVRPVTFPTVEGLIRSDYPRRAVDMARHLVSEEETNPRAYSLLGDALLALGARTEHADLTDKEKKQGAKLRSKLTREEMARKRVESPEGAALMRHNLDAARRAYLQALELPDHTPEVYRGLGYALESLGEWAEAGRSFLTYLRLSPEASDKKVILNHMKVITAQLKQKEVTDVEPRTP